MLNAVASFFECLAEFGLRCLGCYIGIVTILYVGGKLISIGAEICEFIGKQIHK